jgi:hypothetical protein
VKALKSSREKGGEKRSQKRRGWKETEPGKGEKVDRQVRKKEWGEGWNTPHKN